LLNRHITGHQASYGYDLTLLTHRPFAEKQADLETMELRLESNHYDSVPAFLADAQLIFDNCRAYNAETSNYAKNATRLEKYLKVGRNIACRKANAEA